MDALKDIWASLVSGVRERTTNPLSFAFVASWSAWNFRLFIVVFGDGTTAEKLKNIETLYPAVAETYLGGLLYPLLSALGYVFVYPFFSAIAIKFYRAKQVAIANAVKGVEEKRLLTVEQAALLTRRHEQARRHWETKEQELNDELQNLRVTLDKVESDADVAAAEADKRYKDLEQLAAKLSVKQSELEQTKNEPSRAERYRLPKSQPKASAPKLPLDTAPVAAKNPPSERVVGVLSALSSDQAHLLESISDSPGGIHPEVWTRDNDKRYQLVMNDLEKLKGMELVEVQRGGNWTLTALGGETATELLQRKDRK